MITILNTSILTDFGNFNYQPISLEEAREIIKSNEYQSAIGHQSTADIITKLLEVEVKMNRIEFKQENEEKALVFKLKGRPEEGKILSIEDIDGIGYEWGVLTKKESSESSYDSTADTLTHIKRVNELLNKAACILIMRGNVHDQSKLKSPEKELFDEMTPLLKTLTYGTPEYKESLAKLKPALDHHYANNSHHPEFYGNGINGMNIFDVIEMLLDWKAAGERDKDGNIMKSIEINSKRFKMSHQLCQIFRNTVVEMGWDEPKDVGVDEISDHRIFLGGTCNNSTWREKIMPEINVDMFNPVVDDWTPECQEIEMDEKENKCDIHLYVITKEMKGVFSIAEAIDSANNNTKHTFLQVIPDGLEEFQLKSLQAVVDLVKLRGGFALIDSDLSKISTAINDSFAE